MGEDNTSLGGIHISPNAVAAIAYHATLQSYGVVGLAPKNFAEGVALTITHEPARGVSVRYDGENIDIDFYVIVEYGTRITTRGRQRGQHGALQRREGPGHADPRDQRARGRAACQ